MSYEIEKLITGSKQFREKFFNTNSTFFNELVERGQKPKLMVVACSDSRVDPAIIFKCQPGELFVVRNVASLIPPCERGGAYHGTSAALEFGVCFLKVEHIIIFGHTHCGGIQTLLTNPRNILEKKNSFIAQWLALAVPAYEKVMTEHAQVSMEEKIILCEQYALINSLHNARSFPWIQERVDGGRLSVHAWYFDLTTGIIHRYNQEQDSWDIS